MFDRMKEKYTVQRRLNIIIRQNSRRIDNKRYDTYAILSELKN